MQLKRKHKTYIVLGIAALLIIYGLLDMIFKFNFNDNTVNNVTMFLFVIAFALFFSNKKTKQDSSGESEKNSDLLDTPDKAEMDSFAQDTSDKAEVDSSIQDTEASLESDNEQDTSNDIVNSSQVEPNEQKNQEKQIDDPYTK